MTRICEIKVIKRDTKVRGKKVVETNLSTDSGNLAFIHECLSDNLGQGATIKVLHDNPEFVGFHQVGVEVIDHIHVFIPLHDEDLVDNQLLLGLEFEIHLFDGHPTTGGNFNSEAHDTSGSEMQEILKIKSVCNKIVV